MVGLCLQGPRWSYQCSAPVDSVSLSPSFSALSNRGCSVRHLVGQRGRRDGTSSCRQRWPFGSPVPRAPFGRPGAARRRRRGAAVAARRAGDGCAGAPCDAPANEIVAENCLPGDTDWDITGAGSANIQGFATDISVNRGAVGGLQDRHARDRLSPRHLPDGLLRRRGRAQGRDDPAVRDAAADAAGVPERRLAPASSIAATGPCRPRGPSRRPPTRASISRSSCARTSAGAEQASHVFFVVRDDDGAVRAVVPDIRHDLAGVQHVRRQQPLRRQPGRPRLQGQLQPAVRHPQTTERAELRVQRGVPDGALSRAERLRRQLLHRRRHRSIRRRDPRAQGRSCRSATTSTGRASSAPTSRRRATRACTWRSSAATRCSGRRAGRTASTARAPRTARWSATRRRTRNAKIDPSPAWTGTWRDRAIQPAVRRRPARERA